MPLLPSLAPPPSPPPSSDTERTSACAPCPQPYASGCTSRAVVMYLAVAFCCCAVLVDTDGCRRAVLVDTDSLPQGAAVYVEVEHTSACAPWPQPCTPVHHVALNLAPLRMPMICKRGRPRKYAGKAAADAAKADRAKDRRTAEGAAGRKKRASQARERCARVKAEARAKADAVTARAQTPVRIGTRLHAAHRFQMSSFKSGSASCDSCA